MSAPAVAATIPNTPANLASEINNDPLKLGYAAKVAISYQAVADLINLKTGTGSGPVEHVPVDAAAFEAAIVLTELDTLTSGQKQDLQIMLTPGIVNIGTANVQAAINSLFPANAAPGTNAALQALFTQTGSRAEVLFGTGTLIQASDVSIALTGHT